MKYMVMAATDLTAKSLNRERCFETNATGFATETEAQAEADRRNKAEKAAGHMNVEWYPMPQLDLAQMQKMLGQKMKPLIERYNRYSIELDCEPGYPRPSDLIDSVLADTGISVEDFTTDNPFFGHQTWILKKEAGKDDLFTNSKPTFRERVEALYHSGQIRYGSY